jgi:transcription antitermination factor NusG
MKTWYAVYTKKNCERKILNHLKKCKFECIFFLNIINRNGKLVFEPLFPSYIFVKATNSGLIAIQQMAEVINPVYWKNTPVTFSDQDMEDLKIFTNKHVNIEKKSIKIIEEINVFNEDNGTIKNVHLFPKLNIALIAAKIKAPVLEFYKRESYSTILLRMGISFFS